MASRDAICRDPNTYPIMAMDSALVRDAVAANLSHGRTRAAFATDTNAGGREGDPRALHKGGAKDDEKPSDQPHDLDDLKPGIDAAMGGPSVNKLRWLLRRVSPEQFCEWLEAELCGTDLPQAEDGPTPLQKAAMDSALNYTKRRSDLDPLSIAATATFDMRTDDGFRFARKVI